MIKVLVNGCNGKMGNIVCDLVFKNDLFELIGGFDINSNINCNFPIFTSINDINIKPDVIKNFYFCCNFKYIKLCNK